MTSLGELQGWLRAAAEPTRLRLLALCTQRDFSVSDLAAVLRQSEPRVSRHLKVLCQAGLLTRVRQGQWVHYRATSAAAAAAFVRGLLGQVDRRDETLERDRERAQRTESEARSVPAESRLGRALRAFVETNLAGRSAARRAVIIGVDQLELLEAAAGLATECVAVARSRRAAQAARAFAEQRGFPCRVSTSNESIDAAGEATCDILIVNHPAATERPLASVFESARQHLSSEGRLFFFERYEALERLRESAGRQVIEHPLARLRRLLAESAFECTRLTPIEADGEHVLAALAHPAPGLARTGST